jgi:hypothetical protein
MTPGTRPEYSRTKGDSIMVNDNKRAEQQEIRIGPNF